MSGALSPMRVPFAALDRQHAELAEEMRAAFDRLLTSSAFTLGEEVEAFESDFAAYCGTPRAVGVASGTSALTLALSAAGIGPGDEVIVPSHTFIASALGVIHAGATPVFCDVEAQSGLIDVRSASDAVTSRSAAIVAVHLYGQLCDTSALRDLADRRGLFLLEDAAQAHGARCGDRKSGSLGDAAAFSFYPSKNLGGIGDGGAITTADGALADRVNQLRNLGQRRKGVHEIVGYNERLDALQAAILRIKLPRLDAWNARRSLVASRYRELLAPRVRVLTERDGYEAALHLFPIRVEHRDSVAEALKVRGVATGVHYSPSVPRHAAIREWVGMRSSVPDTPEADSWAREELSLPFFAELREDELAYAASTLCQAIDTTSNS